MKILLTVIALLSSFAYAQSNNELARRIEILADEIQQLKANQLKVGNNESYQGLGSSASKVYFLGQGLSIGGYGEIIYKDPRGKDESDAAASSTPQSEVLRTVFYFGYKFSDNWLVNAEIEIEHVDQVFSEFVYIDNLIDESFNLRFGLLLLPMGFTNELHEPVFFPSVNRSEIETQLIPTTWREIGLGTFGKKGNLTYRTYIVNSFDGTDMASSSTSILRSARKKGGAATNDKNTNNLAWTGRLDYELKTNNLYGFSAYLGRASDGLTSDTIPSQVSAKPLVQIYDAHVQFSHKAWMFRGLYVIDRFSDAADFNLQTGRSLPEEMSGFYLEPSYDFMNGHGKKSLKAFVRYEKYDLNKKMPSGTAKTLSNNKENIIFGVAYKPLPRIIFKADYSIKSNKAKSGVDEFNLGMGYNF